MGHKDTPHKVSDPYELYLIFPIFLKFSTLKNYKKFIGHQKIIKIWGMIDWIFICLSTKFQLKIPSFAPQNALMSTQKKYVYSCQMGLGSECSLGGTQLPAPPGQQLLALCKPFMLRSCWATPDRSRRPYHVSCGVRPCLPWAGAVPNDAADVGPAPSGVGTGNRPVLIPGVTPTPTGGDFNIQFTSLVVG